MVHAGKAGSLWHTAGPPHLGSCDKPVSNRWSDSGSSSVGRLSCPEDARCAEAVRNGRELGTEAAIGPP